MPKHSKSTTTAFLPGLGVPGPVPSPSLPTPNDESRSSARALTLLQGDLAKLTIPPTKDKLPRSEVHGLVQVRPLDLKPPKRNTLFASLERIAGRDKTQLAMTGVYLDVPKKRLVATNGHMMVILPDDTLTGKSRILNVDNGSVINARYPSYEDIIPAGRKLHGATVELPALRNQLAGLKRAGSFIDSAYGIRAEIQVGQHFFYYDAELFLLVLEALMSTGTQALRFEFDEKLGRPLLLLDAQDPRKRGILMPVMNTDTSGSSSSARAVYMAFCPVLHFTGNGADEPQPVSTFTATPLVRPASKARHRATGSTPAGRKGKALKKATPSTVAPEELSAAQFAALPWAQQKVYAVQALGKTKIAELLTGDFARLKAQSERFDATANTRTLPEAHAYRVLVKVRQIHDGQQVPFADYEVVGPEKIAANKAATGKTPKAPKKPAAPKAPKASKAAPAKPEPRHVVGKLPEDVLLMKAFVGLTDKAVTQKQVHNLHKRFQKAISNRSVRRSSEHAGYIGDMAALVAKTYDRMVEENVGSVDKLTLRPELVTRIRAAIEDTQVSAAVPLLSRFINMQGTVPDAKAVKSLATALLHYHEEHPKSDYTVAVGAAATVLSAWQPGKVVKVTAAQLNGLLGLAGLGCPDSPGAPCGCAKKAGR